VKERGREVLADVGDHDPLLADEDEGESRLPKMGFNLIIIPPDPF
jgi:hypothetical protein